MINLIDYGYVPTMLPPDADGIPARVTAAHKERYELVCEQGRAFGKLKASRYHTEDFPRFREPEPYPTAGDFVLIQYNPCGDSRIVKTLCRKSFFSRRDPAPGRGEQAVAANFDDVFLLTSLNQDFNLRRIERYLTLAWQSGGVPSVILTKADLADDFTEPVRALEKLAPGVGVFAVSAKTGYGLDALSAYLKPRKTIAFLGSSGVGKSSLVNALAGEDIMGVDGIRESDGKGRHTTTHRQLILLKSGVMVIDTPGMRELGMWDVSAGLGEAFADVEQYFGKCRFSDCRHQSEPGCAVKAAIASGRLSRERWESYQNLKREARFSDDKEEAFSGKREREKEIAKLQKQLKKPDYRGTACAESFTCKVCGAFVVPEGAGSGHRNHCPHCLSSVHVDSKPGDRASLCKGIMDPIGVWVRKNGEWAIIHRCRSCGALRSNRIAADDNPALLLSIAVKPLAMPPFPLGQLEQDVGKAHEK